MNIPTRIVVIAAAFACGFGVPRPGSAQGFTVSEPSTVASLDMGRLKGEPSRLAWAPDGSELYIQTREGAFGQADAKLHHYIFSAAKGSKRDVDAEPEWASAYWTAKSAQASPDDPGLKIAVKTETRQQRTTSMPMGGDMARGGSAPAEAGTTSGDALAAAYASQRATVHMMQLKGATVGEFVNSVIVPGLTFGWAPKGTKAIAFTEPKDGRVVVMGAEGATREVEGTEDAVLPAWSQDGARLAWLQQDGRRKYVLRVAGVTPQS
jgi:dipeptidyl aminopeptidase/acylaminoacyl peptidase